MGLRTRQGCIAFRRGGPLCPPSSVGATLVALLPPYLYRAPSGASSFRHPGRLRAGIQVLLSSSLEEKGCIAFRRGGPLCPPSSVGATLVANLRGSAYGAFPLRHPGRLRAGVQVHLLLKGKNHMSFLCWPKERTKERACPGLGTPALNFQRWRVLLPPYRRPTLIFRVPFRWKLSAGDGEPEGRAGSQVFRA
jgi:hypothetical protein